VRGAALEGVVYNFDDDNEYAPRLFAELRTLGRGRVGSLAVRFAVAQSERLSYDRDGHFEGFDAGWCRGSWMAWLHGKRTYCVDMGGFAFDAALLRGAPLSCITGSLCCLGLRPFRFALFSRSRRSMELRGACQVPQERQLHRPRAALAWRRE
jgi:hypothetical protein